MRDPDLRFDHFHIAWRGKAIPRHSASGRRLLVVIETDGSYEQVDSLKAAYDGAPETGLNLFDHAIDVVGQHPGIVAREQGISGLCQTCQECPVVSSAAGVCTPTATGRRTASITRRSTARTCWR